MQGDEGTDLEHTDRKRTTASEPLPPTLANDSAAMRKVRLPGAMRVVAEAPAARPHRDRGKNPDLQDQGYRVVMNCCVENE